MKFLVLFLFLSLVYSKQGFLNSKNAFRIPLKRLHRTTQQNQIFISLLNTYHDELKYPSFLERKSSIHLKNFGNTQFVGEVGVGSPPQWLDVIFDTGSSNFFINSKYCKAETCISRPYYDHKLSYTFESIGFILKVQFGTGEITGEINEELITIGGIQLKKQRFAEVSNEIGEVFIDAKFAGILGLGFETLAAAGTIPIFDSIVKSQKLEWNVISFYYSLDHDEESEVLFGNVNTDKFIGDIIWIPIRTDLLDYWLIEIDDILLGTHSLGFCKNKCKAVIDTGTTLISAPQSQLEELMEYMDKDCSEFANYPDLVFVIAGKKFSLSPKNYIITNIDDEPGTHSKNIIDCSLAFISVEVAPPNGPLWVLGDVFLSSYYTIFDKDNLSIGLAPAKHKKI